MNKEELINNYNENSITALDNRMSVRIRPAMYIGDTGLNGVTTCVREIVDNSVDEHSMGVGDVINVKIYNGKDGKFPYGWCEVEDHGRGMPVGLHSVAKYPDGSPMSTLTYILTNLHCGGKFLSESKNGYSGSQSGLHGVGASCVMFLSEKFVATVKRNGEIHRQTFEQGLETTKVEKIGTCDKDDTGTTIGFLLDKTIFKSTIVPSDAQLINLFDETTALNNKLTINYENEISGINKTFNHPEGIKSYISKLCDEETKMFEEPFYIEDEEIVDDKNIKVAIAFTYDNPNKTHETFKTFANNVNTHEGGYHLNAFRDSLKDKINTFGINNNMIKEDLEMKYIMENIICIISVKLPEAQYEGQTKGKLASDEVKPAIANILDRYFSKITKERKDDISNIVTKSLKTKMVEEAARKARNEARAMQKMSNQRSKLPGKLTDCTNKKGYREIICCEGDSAGGAIKLGRFPEFQAVLPLRGKILNVEKTDISKMLNSETISNITNSIGTGIGDKFNIKKMRYDKFIIMTDADTDGSHIRILILTLFYKYMRPLIEEGYVYAAVPPLFRIEFKDRTYEYVKDDLALEEAKKKYGNKIINVSRFKGLGEMDYTQLRETVLDPRNRVLNKITLQDCEKASEELIKIAMGKDAEVRRIYIEENSNKANLLNL